MRAFLPGQIALPLILILSGMLLVLSRFDIVQVARYWDLWPVTLIAAGLEELYLWASSGDDKSRDYKSRDNESRNGNVRRGK